MKQLAFHTKMDDRDIERTLCVSLEPTPRLPEPLGRPEVRFSSRSKKREPISLSDIYKKFMQYYRIQPKKSNKNSDSSSDSDSIPERITIKKKSSPTRPKRTPHKRKIKRSVTLPNFPMWVFLHLLLVFMSGHGKLLPIIKSHPFQSILLILNAISQCSLLIKVVWATVWL